MTPALSVLPGLFVILFFALLYLLAYEEWFDRAILFVLAAMAITYCGTQMHFYHLTTAWASLMEKVDILCFFIGMNILTAILSREGFFDHMAERMTSMGAGSPRKIMVWVCSMTYAVSLFVNNLTTMLALIPILLSLARRLNFNPRAYLIGMVVASNLGGASTMVGDFPNMLIGTEAGIPFSMFAVYMMPICLIELLILIAYMQYHLGRPGPHTRNSLSAAPAANAIAKGVRDGSPAGLTAAPGSRRAGLRYSRALRNTLWILGALVMGFLFSDLVHIPPAYMALAAGALALFLTGRRSLEILGQLNYKDILFFSGLFVLVGAAEASGLVAGLAKTVAGLSSGNVLAQCLILIWIAAFVTAFMNAGPAAALFLPLVMNLGSAAPHELYWWSLSLGVLAGSSATLTGATAGAVAQTMLTAHKSRFPLSFAGYARLGVPIAFMFLVVSSVYVTLIYRYV